MNEYSTEELLQAERRKRIEWWRVLKILRDEYLGLVDAISGQFDMHTFDQYIDINYGVKLVYDQQGNITGNYDITNKNKHLILLMKYGK